MYARTTTTQKYSRVKCSVCGNSWFQSRERLFDIPKETHDLLPADKSDLDRVARNLAKDLPAAYMGDYKLYVGNLDFHTTPNDLFEFFENIFKGTQDPWEKLAKNDVNKQMVQFDNPHKHFAKWLNTKWHIN